MSKAHASITVLLYSLCCHVRDAHTTHQHHVRSCHTYVRKCNTALHLTIYAHAGEEDTCTLGYSWKSQKSTVGTSVEMILDAPCAKSRIFLEYVQFCYAITRCARSGWLANLCRASLEKYNYLPRVTPGRRRLLIAQASIRCGTRRW